jgi:hypothetical protein
VGFNIDEDLDNADWAKSTWDLDIDNVDDLRAYLAAMDISVDDFKALPVYRANVDNLPWLKDL